MATHVVSEEYISPEILTGIFEFLSFQQVSQVSTVNKTFKAAVDIQVQHVSAMATRIQRCFRRWRERKVFLREQHHDPQLWIQYFGTEVGKRYGKALFKAYFTKFIRPISEPLYWCNVLTRTIVVLTRWEALNREELEIIYKIQDAYADLSWEDRCGPTTPLPRQYALRLINEVLIPYMDREGYDMIYNGTTVMFGTNAPAVWENYHQIDISFRD